MSTSMNLNRVAQITRRQPLRRALISVADKTGLEDLVRHLWNIIPDLHLYSTGGTYSVLEQVHQEIRGSLPDHPGILTQISAYTRQREMQGGLVKTLDFRIYLGLLGEDHNEAHRDDLERTGAVPFDLTICNFYPFQQAADTPGATLEDLRTHIDIGGPTMLRASAKNFLRLTALHSPRQYPRFLEEVKRECGHTTLEYRVACAREAFRYIADYDNAIAAALASSIESTDLNTLYHDPREENL